MNIKSALYAAIALSALVAPTQVLSERALPEAGNGRPGLKSAPDGADWGVSGGLSEQSAPVRLAQTSSASKRPVPPPPPPEQLADAKMSDIAGDTILTPKTRYWSSSGNHYLIWAPDQNLTVRTSDGTQIWGADIPQRDHQRVSHVRWHGTGKLSVYPLFKEGTQPLPIWSTDNDANAPDAQLILQDNGVLQVISPSHGLLWSSDGQKAQPVASESNLAAAAPAPDDSKYVRTLVPGTDLVRGERIWSDDKSHYLRLNPDGNIVVGRADDRYVWGLDSVVADNAFVRIARAAWQPDGRLVGYAADGSEVWAAPAAGAEPNSQLALGSDGALQIVSPTKVVLWSSKGAPPQQAAAPAPDDSKYVRTLVPGTDLVRGERIWSDDKSHYLRLNPDGNIVVGRADDRYVWGLDSVVADNAFVRIARAAWQPDGRLVGYAADGSEVWAAPAAGAEPNSQLVLGSDGALQIVSPIKVVLWSSKGDVSPRGDIPPALVPEEAAPTQAAQTQTAGQAVAPQSPAQAAAPIARGAALPAARTFAFKAAESRVLPGTLPAVGSGFNCAQSLAPQEQDKIGQFAVASEFYQKGCFTDGDYNQLDFKVEKGVLNAENGTAFDSYVIHPAAQGPKAFLGSHHGIYYAFAESKDQAVYSFDGGVLKKLADIPASQIVPGQFVKIPNLDASLLDRPTTLVFAASDQPLSSLHKLAEGVEGAQIADTPLGLWESYRYNLPGTPFDTVQDYTAGPNTHQNVYGQTRRFFGVDLSGQAGIVWQDASDNDKIYLTFLGTDLRANQTIPLPNGAREKLAAVTHDDQGAVYYLTIQRGGTEQNQARGVHLYKVNDTGAVLAQATLNGQAPRDPSSLGDALNISDFADFVADMAYSNGQLGLMLARRLHRGSDGLQHQSGGGFVFDASTLKMSKSLGQTSGHSFGNVLSVAQNGAFVGIDLGDNYPRGVNLHDFDQNGIKSRVVYAFKSEHGDTPQSPAGTSYPRYSEISGGGKTFYKWSNDNRTYTELGGLSESASGLSIVFVGEPDAAGNALQNGRTGAFLNDARNIGLVKVKRDFFDGSDPVLTQGPVQTGGFYTFGGTWTEHSNKGIVWLTRYTDSARENASRVKTARLADGNILVLWEVWTPESYVSTHAMKVSDTGQLIGEPVELGSAVRLGRQDDPLVIGNRVLFVAGDKTRKELLVTSFQL